MIKHIVVFKFKPGLTEAQRQSLVDGLNALPALISDIKSMKVVKSVPGRPAPYSIALFSEFEDLAALDRYVAHPDHQKIVKLVNELSETRLGFDYE